MQALQSGPLQIATAQLAPSCKVQEAWPNPLLSLEAREVAGNGRQAGL